MIVAQSWAELPCSAGGLVAAIGNFDGLHRGHRAIISGALAQARATSALGLVLTFEPHTAVVVRPETAPPLLTPGHERLRVLEAWGVDAVLLYPFTAATARREAEDFVAELAASGVRHVYVGYNFRFGRGGLGDAARLQVLGAALGVQVTVVAPVTLDGQPVSSSAVRAALQRGEIEAAARALGRPFIVWGQVVQGDKRGRTLGYPTANVSIDARQAMPAPGIYAGRAALPDGSCPLAAISWGYRPTFDGQGLRLEAHLLDFQGTLYGQTVAVAFYQRLRGEERFASVETLCQQMERDVAAVRRQAQTWTTCLSAC